MLGNSDKESRQTERVDLNFPRPSEPNATEINKHTPSRPGCSKDVEQDQTMVIMSPEAIEPYPKAKQRKILTKGRKQGRTMIATDTPEKLKINLIKIKKDSVKRKLNINQNLTTAAKKNKSKNGKTFKKWTAKTGIKKNTSNLHHLKMIISC